MGIMGIINVKGGSSMNSDSVYSQIAEIEREIALLPKGSITKKKINNKDYYYVDPLFR